ncbi:winged helix-turn-helix domain-containing protein [Roseateles sp.]
MAVPIEPQPLELLRHLLHGRGRVVTKTELAERLWPAAKRSNAALDRCLLKLRRALGDQGGKGLIRTVPRVGYRFVLEDTSEPARNAAPIRLAVLPLRNESGDRSLDWACVGVAVLVGELLARDGRFAVESMSSMLSVLGEVPAEPASRVQWLQRTLGVPHVVHASLVLLGTPHGDRLLRIDYELHGRDGMHPRERRSTAAVDAIAPVNLGEALAHALKAHFLGPTASEGPAPGQNGTPTIAMESFARGLQAAAEQRWAAACRLYRLALDFDPQHREAELHLLRAMAELGHDQVGVQAMADRVLSGTSDGHDGHARALAHLALGRFHLLRADYGLARVHLEKAEGHADAIGASEVLVRALLTAASVDLYQAKIPAVRERLERMRECCEAHGHQLAQLSCTNVEAACELSDARYSQAAALARTVATQARRHSQQRSFGLACGNACEAHANLGELEDAYAWGADGLAAATAHGHEDLTEALISSLAWVRRLAGRTADDLLLLLPGQACSADAPWRARGHAATAAGRTDEAVQCFDVALRWSRSCGRTMHEQEALPWYIEALIRAGHDTEAHRELQRCEDMASTDVQNFHLHTVLLRAFLDHSQGRPEHALMLLKAAVHAQPAAMWQGWALADAAWISAGLGALGEAKAFLGRMPKTLQALPAALAAQARVEFAAGRPREAKRLLGRSLAGREHGGACQHLDLLRAAYTAAAAGIETEHPSLPLLPSRM